jgi:hypothetical protein
LSAALLCKGHYHATARGNGAGQRQRNTLADNTYTTYAYDDDGQLTNSLRR